MMSYQINQLDILTFLKTLVKIAMDKGGTNIKGRLGDILIIFLTLAC